jgi:NAD(P)-dependent dehydrogenase (short-subunit alcohol dehydrogenase family)
VTGATSGIGRATALALAERGDRLVLLARSAETLEETARECRARGAVATPVVADVADAAAVEEAFAAAAREHGRVDAVVHSAAVLAYGRFEDVPAEVFDRALAVTLGGTANVARSALGHFRSDPGPQGGRGSLVVVGSLLGKIAVPFMSSYVTAKWGVHALVRTLQIEARGEPGIAVSLVSPGGVNTPVYRQAGTYLGWHGRPPPPVDPPQKVARAVLRAIDRPRRDDGVGVANPVVVLGFRALPVVFDAWVTPLMRVGGISRDAAAPGPGNVLDAAPHGEAVHGAWGRHWLRPAAVAGLGAAALGVRAGTELRRRRR